MSKNKRLLISLGDGLIVSTFTVLPLLVIGGNWQYYDLDFLGVAVISVVILLVVTLVTYFQFTTAKLFTTAKVLRKSAISKGKIILFSLGVGLVVGLVTYVLVHDLFFISVLVFGVPISESVLLGLSFMIAPFISVIMMLVSIGITSSWLTN